MKIRARLTEEEKRQTLPDGSKGDLERIFEWSWAEFRYSISLCAPTAMVLTFADWHHPSNAGVKEGIELAPETRDFVRRMEVGAYEVLGRRVPVFLIRTGREAHHFVEGDK